jgi:hypothetical protein
VIILCSIQVLHFLWREGGISVFPVQMRIAYLLLILVGQWDLLTFILWMQALCTTIELLLGCCTLARVLALMPWNRRKLLSWQLILQVFSVRRSKAVYWKGFGRRSVPMGRDWWRSRPTIVEHKNRGA